MRKEEKESEGMKQKIRQCQNFLDKPENLMKRLIIKHEKIYQRYESGYIIAPHPEKPNEFPHKFDIFKINSDASSKFYATVRTFIGSEKRREVEFIDFNQRETNKNEVEVIFKQLINNEANPVLQPGNTTPKTMTPHP